VGVKARFLIINMIFRLAVDPAANQRCEADNLVIYSSVDKNAIRTNLTVWQKNDMQPKIGKYTVPDGFFQVF
jgi:hypothetical protein